MHLFKDSNGRSWPVAINVAAMKRVRDLAKVNLYELLDEKMEKYAALVNDPMTFVDVLFILCMDEAKKENVSDESFGRAMAGDALEAAVDAFTEELIDFFPQAQTRKSLRKVTAAAKAVQKKVMERAETELDALDVDKLATTLIGSFGSSPASSASIPTPAPSAS